MTATQQVVRRYGLFSDIVVATQAPHVLQIRLNRPEVRNALRTATLAEIAAALAQADVDDDARVVIVTGGEQIFAAGADIRELAALDGEAARRDIRPRHWAAIAGFSKPLIAAVGGLALGAGCEMALLADLLVASENARFGQPEIKLGLIPGAGGTQRLIRAVGRPLAMKMVLTGETLDAAAAGRAGLLSDLVPAGNCESAALELASLIASSPPLAVRTAKRLLHAAEETGLGDGLRAEREAFCSLLDTRDKQEGIAAFLEKRKPVFWGR